MINAAEAVVGQKYDTIPGIHVEVVEKTPVSVIVKSLETGNNVVVPLDYKLDAVGEAVTLNASPLKVVTEEVMSNDTNTVEAPKKVKKSDIVDNGLRSNLSVDEIVKNVQQFFPETLEKNVRNLVSVRRSKLKKSNTATPTT